jgi:hypothetical protein
MVHCGEGWGRTGTVLTALYLLSDKGDKKSKRTTVQLGKYDQNKLIDADPHVVHAIEFMRKHDKAHATNPKHKYTCTTSCSVEKEKQVRWLEHVWRNRTRLRAQCGMM